MQEICAYKQHYHVEHVNALEKIQNVKQTNKYSSQVFTFFKTRIFF